MAARPPLNPRFAAFAVAALLLGPAGCDDDLKSDQPKKDTAQPAAKPAKNETIDVTLDGKKFTLELALDPATRFKGLSDRTEIKGGGGMLFAFEEPTKLDFVMRDCPMAIDIIFIDGSGTITAMHKMVPESPRTAEEKVLTDGSNKAYEERLKRYPSKLDAQFVIELKGNSLDSMKLKEGQTIDLDWAALKKRVVRLEGC